MAQIRVPDVAGLADGEARSFSFARDGETQAGFVLRRGEHHYAYLNRCPHWGVDLDMGEGRFFSPLVGQIVCRTHGALFEPSTGTCTAGPCLGRSLESFALRLEGGDALVEVPGAAPLASE